MSLFSKKKPTEEESRRQTREDVHAVTFAPEEKTTKSEELLKPVRLK